MAKQIVDPWLEDDGFNTIDFGMGKHDEVILDDDLPPAPITPALTPEVIQTQTPEPTPEVQVVPPPPVEEDTPETMDLDDGTQLTLEKDKGQWKGSVIGQSGNPQIYWGKTKNELVFNILKAQANATKKIREQNARLKFNSAP